MAVETPDGSRLSDYSLTGRDAALAVEKGLADAKWYVSPVPRDKMRELLTRRDGPAIRDTLIWFGLLFASGYCGYLLWGSWWALIPFAIYGVLYATVSDSRWHETSHGTAFKSDWMNNALYEISSFMIRRESIPWRWSHTRHYSDTIIVRRDLEIPVPRPANLKNVCLTFFSITPLPNYLRGLYRHCLGRMSAEDRDYIPATEFGRVILMARIYVLIYAGIIALAVYSHSFLPLIYFILPHFYGSWLTVIYGLTQHAGLAENVLDHRLNSRTVYMNWLNRYFYWEMNYHVEHHMFPLVPYHALAKLHQLVKEDMPQPYNGLLEAYREIIPTLRRQAKDPAYYVRRQLPPPAARADAPAAAQAIRSEEKPDPEGWIEVCESGLLQKEDVLRFDHDHQTFAVYRTHDDQYFASDGTCTHGNAHLADGFVKGTLIECAKHNGRFDIRDGSPQRLPVCTGLKTFGVRSRGGKLALNVLSAGGYGVTAAAPGYAFRVVSNENVATFIKELVLEPAGDSPKLIYQPGDYLQIDIPAYASHSLENVDVQAPYAGAWKAQQVFGLKVENPAACRRNYSLASNPERDPLLRFNVRIALPPRGVNCSPGVGSSYIFGLKAGERVTAIGPFGAFHIKETGRERVYLGGGAGMAPLRSHLSWLLETQKITTRVSYWYGARSLQEMFYQDYFEALVRQNPNFSFHAALSDPLAEDHWSGESGFIHDVLKRAYLDSHPDPKSIEYFLCGPPAMIQAATVMLKNLGVPPTQIACDEF